MDRKSGKSPILECYIATAEDIDSFSRKESLGPSAENFKLQFGSVRATPWNTQAAAVVFERVYDSGWSRYDDKKTLRKIIRAHINHLATLYKTQKKRAKKSLTDEEHEDDVLREQRRRNVSS